MKSSDFVVFFYVVAVVVVIGELLIAFYIFIMIAIQLIIKLLIGLEC